MVSRRTVLQDLARSYVVTIDGEPVGRLRAFQTSHLSVSPGVHRLRLTMPSTGSASSDDLIVDLAAGEIRTFRTQGRGFRSFITLPVAGVIAIIARVRRQPFETALYRRPWIVLREAD